MIQKNMIKPPTEHEEQKELIQWARLKLPSELKDLLFAIPNGGLRTPKNGKTLKAEGVHKGVPDLFFAYPSGGFCGLFIEMKRRDPNISRVSKEQAEMILKLEKNGYCARVCYGCLNAYETIQQYLDLNNKDSKMLKNFAERENQ